MNLSTAYGYLHRLSLHLRGGPVQSNDVLHLQRVAACHLVVLMVGAIIQDLQCTWACHELNFMSSGRVAIAKANLGLPPELCLLCCTAGWLWVSRLRDINKCMHLELAPDSK